MSPAAIARSPIVPLFAEPSLRVEQVSQLVLGEAASVLESNGEWRRLRSLHDEYEGWAHAGYVVEVEEDAAERWRSEARGWSLGAVIRIGENRVRIPLRARVGIEGETVRLPDGRRGRLVEGTVPTAGEAAASARGKAPERWALEYFSGASYEWGGVTPWGVDCSGLVQTTFAARGVQLPRDSSQQVACGAEVSADTPQPGDLLFFRGETTPRITHVAFAGEADGLVHSTVSCGGVLAESWLPGSRAAPLRARLVAVRRLELR
jgi:gamma-D-glutamyl-L-lysine dipeptidyl-peptidase